MFQIAICDEEVSVCAAIEAAALQHKERTSAELETAVFLSGEALCGAVKQGAYFDLIFLDIEMPSMNGVEVGHKIREDMDNQTTQIVYVSARESYYLELFAVRPMDFIGKPIREERIIKAIEQAQMLCGKLKGTFDYKDGYDTVKVPYREIILLESAMRKIRLVTIHGMHYFYGNLNSIEQELTAHRFMRVHRAYLVNYGHVTKFSHDELMMSNGERIPISRPNQKAVRSLQNQWDRER